MRSELAQGQLPPSNSPVLSYHSDEAVIARRHHRGGNGGYKPFLLTVFSITYTDSGLHRTNNRTISNLTFLAINRLLNIVNLLNEKMNIEQGIDIYTATRAGQGHYSFAQC